MKRAFSVTLTLVVSLSVLFALSGCSRTVSDQNDESAAAQSQPATHTQTRSEEAEPTGAPRVPQERPEPTTPTPESNAMPDREAISEAAERIAERSLRDAERTEAEWRELLSEEEYRVLRQQGTERAGSGDLLRNSETGIYTCAGCGSPLFASADKFESGTGWPSFTQAVQEGRVEEREDRSHGMVRIEVVCARCGGHLGHVFPDGPPPTGQRYCMNSAALDFEAVDFSSED